MKKFKKILIIILIFLAGFAVGNTVKYFLDFWRADSNVQGFVNLLEAPYKNDTYGGKTPEETFDLYLSALKKGDLELASKYFASNKRESRLKVLKNENTKTYIQELESIDKNKWIKKISNNQADIHYAAIRYAEKEIKTVNNSGKIITKKLSKGNYSSTMSFIKIKDFWKIYLL